MKKVPSIDWPRRTNPLSGSEDLLKQNPISDVFPQEERIPVNLISDFTISNLSFSNVGTGIGTFDFKNGGDIDFRSLGANSNKVSVGLSGKTILLDVDPLNIVSNVTITNLSGVTAPTASNQYLMWDGGGYVFNSSPFSFDVIAEEPSNNINISNGSTLNFVGSAPIYTTVAMGSVFIDFSGTLNDLDDVNIVGTVPNGYVLGYDSNTSTWGAISPAAASAYSFSMKGDGVDIFSVDNLSTVSLLGNGGTITTAVTGINEIQVDWAANLSDLSDVSTQAPLNDQALVYNSGTSKWEPKAVGSNYNFVNGLTAFGSDVYLGGTLIESGGVDGNNYNHQFGFFQMDAFTIDAGWFNIFGYNGNGDGGVNHYFKFRSSEQQGITTLTATRDAEPEYVSIRLKTINERQIDIDAINPSVNERYRLQTTANNAGVYYLTGTTIRCGFQVQEDKIVVMDGVNNPTAGDVLTYMSDGTSQFQPSSGNLNFTNGLTKVGSDVKLGGTLTEGTVILGGTSNYSLSILDLGVFILQTQAVGTEVDHIFNIASNGVAGNTTFTALDTAGQSKQMINMHTNFFQEIDIDSLNENTDERFRVQTSLDNAGMYYISGSTIKNGFQVQKDKIVVMDGVNSNPTIGDVLSYVSGGTVEYKPVIDLITGGSEGEYLSVVSGSAAWVAPKERINICEFDSTVDIATGNGLKFFVVPTEMDGWTINEYTASVYQLGSGISTRFELLVNGVTVVGSALTMGGKFDSNTGINYVVSEGDTISINVLNTKPTPDKGLSVTITLSK